MKIARKVGSKGQVVIPEQIRKEAGIREGTVLLFDYQEGQMTVIRQKADAQLLEDFCETVSRDKKHRFDVNAVFETAYQERLKSPRKRA